MGGTLWPNDPPTSKIGSWPMDYLERVENKLVIAILVNENVCTRIWTRIATYTFGKVVINGYING